MSIDEVNVDPSVAEIYREVKLRATYRYVIFKFDRNTVVIDEMGDPSKTYNDFLQRLENKDCRYAIFDFEFQHNTRNVRKIVFFNWCPDSSQRKTKAQYVSGMQTVTAGFTGLVSKFEGANIDDLKYETVKEDLIRKRRFPFLEESLFLSINGQFIYDCGECKKQIRQVQEKYMTVIPPLFTSIVNVSYLIHWLPTITITVDKLKITMTLSLYVKCEEKKGAIMTAKIYFAGSIGGGRQDVEMYGKIIEKLKSYGDVLTEFVGDKNITDEEGTLDFIAEVTQTSLGVGYEIGSAKFMNKNILCLYRPREGKRLSVMIRGSHNGESFIVKDYKDLSELDGILKTYFDSKN